MKELSKEHVTIYLNIYFDFNRSPYFATKCTFYF